MSKRSSYTMVLILIAALLLGVFSPLAAQERITVVWFVGLGTGTNEAQQEAQERVVAAFNESQDEIEIQLNVAASYEAARDAITTLIASGNAPDIVGPVGNDGANTFAGSWLDLESLVESSGYDLSQFPQASVDFYRTDEGLVGLPLAVFPSFIYYNRDLFDEAGLEYPPQEFGAPYVLDGEEVEWNWDTLAEIAQILTVDANGEDATSPDFDPESVVQFGFVQQWNDVRNELQIFGADRIWDPESGEVSIPETWRDAAQWNYDAIWTENFAPNSSYLNSELLQGGGGAFSSGNVAMARTHLWYTCCLGGSNIDWDIAVVPSHNGEYVSTLHADTFRVMRMTRNPEATFEVLSYLVGDASLDLLGVYGGMPAREEDRADFFAALDETYPQGVNWQVAMDSLNYPDIPSHESFMPNYSRARDRLTAFQSLYQSTPGLDLSAELDELEADLQAIVGEA